MAISDLEKRVYGIFSPAPLRKDQDNLYVDMDSVRGKADIVSRLSNTILLSGTPCTQQVLAGHKGCGKSTELMRLKTLLDKEPNNYFVVMLDIFENLDQNDVDFPDLLIEIVRQIAVQLKERMEIDLKSGYFMTRLREFKDLLFSDVEIDKVEFDCGLAKASAAIKNSLTARNKIRKALEPHTSNLLDAANELIGEAALKLADRNKAGLVVLVDNLDKITIRPHAHGDCDTAEYLFVRRGAQMTAFRCHTVYTIPLSLAYSHYEGDIRRMYGGHLPLVPATKIATQPPDSKPYKPGVECFRQIVRKRLDQVNASESDVFASEAILNELISLTGGQPTELMALIREAITTDGLPIGKAGLERANSEGRREYARMLRSEHWPFITEVRETGNVKHSRSKENEEAFRQMLNSRAILQYVNDEEWYGQNPMVAQLEPPGKAPR